VKKTDRRIGQPRLGGSRPLLAAITLVAVSPLAGCTSAPTAEAAIVAAEVAGTVEQQIDVRPSVDCGTDRMSIADGAVIDCTVTDPRSELTYDARIDIINPGGDDHFTLNLTVANDPKP
jgi:hypothetical protein